MADLPDWIVERYYLGELPEEEIRRIDRLRAEDPSLERRIAAIEESNREILAAHPPEKMAAEIERQAAERGETAAAGTPAQKTASKEADPSGRKGRRVLSFPFEKAAFRIGVPAAAAAALAFFLLFSNQLGIRSGISSGVPGAGQAYEDTGIRLKGAEPGIHIYRKAGDEVEALSPGDSVAEGDVLQPAILLPDSRHGLLFSVDGRGVLTLHYPRSTGESTRLPESGRVLLDSSYRLDDAPDFEHFYLLASDNPIDVEAVLSQLRRRIASGEESSGSVPESRLAGEQWYVFPLEKKAK